MRRLFADPMWQRAKITVSPGITAMQAAAARAGAPLGHDFCAISLSDLMTPRALPLLEEEEEEEEAPPRR
mgnify:CR=1 FL=1